MHRPDSVELAVVLEGETDILMDDTKIHLIDYDVVIQRGTSHAWSNRGTET